MLLIVNGKDRVRGNSSSFTYQFQTPVEQIAAYRVNKVSIPFSYYNIRAQQLDINGDLFNIPAGNYSPQTFKSWWDSNVIPSLAVPINILYNTVQNTYTFSSAAVFTFDFTIADVPHAYSLSKVFGLQNFGPVLTKESGVLNFSATSNLYLQSTQLTNHPSFFNTKRSAIFQSVPVEVNPFNWIVQENQLETVYPYGTDMTSFDITVLDAENNVVDLNGLDIIIEFQCYR